MDQFESKRSWQGPARVHLALMLSGQAAKLLGVKSRDLPKVDDLESVGHWSECWRCEFLTVHKPSRTNYFLCTNPRTLFSIIIPNQDGQKSTVIKELGNELLHAMHREGIVIPPKIELYYDLFRGQPRSLIGSQNELIFLASYQMAESGTSLESVTDYLNKVPLFAIEEVFPNVAFKKALKEDPPFLPPAGAGGEGMVPGWVN